MRLTENLETHACQKCQGGRKHLQTITLMTWLGDDLITVPDFPAWVCDLCGHRLYDSHAFAQLSLFLIPEAATSIQRTLNDSHKILPANLSPLA